jgi:hypothetical protein
MRVPKFIAQAAVVSAGTILFSGAAHAIDLPGAWATDTSACAKVFVKKGNKTAARRIEQSERQGNLNEVSRNPIP